MPKLLRQRRILELVSEEPVESQDDLRRRLARSGLRVTQATLSRDIKDLGLVKTAQGYAQPGNSDDIPSAVAMPPLTHLLREFVVQAREAQNLLVLKTSPGSAQPVAVALDGEEWPEMVGSIAGDDTILLIARDRKTCRRLAQRIRDVIE